MTNDEARSLLSAKGFGNSFINHCFSPLANGWKVSAYLSSSVTLRIEQSDGGMTSEYAIELETGDWTLYDVGLSFTLIGRGVEQLAKTVEEPGS
jgi:hypothetical protein